MKNVDSLSLAISVLMVSFFVWFFWTPFYQVATDKVYKCPFTFISASLQCVEKECQELLMKAMCTPTN